MKRFQEALPGLKWLDFANCLYGTNNYSLGGCNHEGSGYWDFSNFVCMTGHHHVICMLKNVMHTHVLTPKVCTEAEKTSAQIFFAKYQYYRIIHFETGLWMLTFNDNVWSCHWYLKYSIPKPVEAFLWASRQTSGKPCSPCFVASLVPRNSCFGV